MNVEQLIRQYLYENKSISLPGFGKLAFAGDVQLPTAMDKAENFPLIDLNFVYNLHQLADEEFVAFVSEQTGKIKPLATSDVDSFFTLAKQFVNIGKVFVIDGVGVITKKDNGHYAFESGNFMPVVEIQSNLRKPLKIREPIPIVKRDINLRDEPIQINKKLVAIIAGVVILVVIIWAIVHYTTNHKNESTTSTVANSVPKENDNIVAIPTPTEAHKDSIVAPQITGFNNYKAIFEITKNKLRATERVAKLLSYKINVQMDTKDSITFRLWIPITSAPTDTLHKRDSLSKYFARPVFLENN